MVISMVTHTYGMVMSVVAHTYGDKHGEPYLY